MAPDYKASPAPVAVPGYTLLATFHLDCLCLVPREDTRGGELLRFRGRNESYLDHTNQQRKMTLKLH